MRRFSILAVCCTALALSGAANADVMNLLDDPSLEAASDGTQTSNSNWVLSADMPDGVTTSAEFSATVWAASDGATGVWFRSFEGNQDMGDTTANAELSQTVSSVAEGGDYTLTFESARETSFSAGTMRATLSSNGTGGMTFVELLTATYNDSGNMSSNPTTFTLQLFGVSAGDDVTVSVEMIDGVDAMSNPQSLMVDNFCLSVDSDEEPPPPPPPVPILGPASPFGLGWGVLSLFGLLTLVGTWRLLRIREASD